MSEKTPAAVLKKVLNDVANTQQLLDTSIALAKSLESTDFNCTESKEDLIDKTKVIVDQLREKVISFHSYFYKYYRTWKNKKGTSTESESKSESSENEERVRESSCAIVNDNFDSRADCITDDKTKDMQSSDEIISVNLKNNKVETNNEITIDNISKDVENVDNVSKENENIEDKSIESNDLQNVNDSITHTNSEICSAPTETQTVCTVETLNSDKSLENTSESNLEDKNRQTEIVNVDQIMYDLNEEKVAEEVDLNKDISDDHNMDPLNDGDHLTNNDIGDPESNFASSMCNNDIALKSESPAVKHEPIIKIKCVDIKKLLDPETASPEVGNASVVVISDSDNESPTKKNKRSKVKNDSILYFNENNSVTVIPKKKVIVLDDSDSNDCTVANNEKRKSHLPNKHVRNNTRTRTHPKSIESTNNISRSKGTDKSQKQSTRKFVHDLANVSSLSENSITSSSENDDIIQSKKRSKLKMKESDDYISPLDTQRDEKFLCKAYVPLTRIPAKQLKSNYEKQLMKMDIKKLTNMESLKRSRRKGSESSDSVHSKVKKKKKNKEKKTDEDQRSSDTDVSMSEQLEKNNEDIFNELKGSNLKEGDAEVAKTLLDDVRSVDSNSNTNVESDDKEQEETAQKCNDAKENLKEKDKELESKKDDKESEKDSDSKTNKKERKKWRNDKLLTENVTESDSEEDFARFMKKKDKLDERKSDTEDVISKKPKKRLSKLRRKKIIDSDSDSSSVVKQSSTSESNNSESEKSSDENEKQKRVRRRIKRVKESSDENEDEEKSTRKNIRKVWKKDSLAQSTIAAEKEEQERKARIAERQKKYNQIFEADALEKASVDKVVLDFNDETEEELLKVDPKLVKHLKPHQAKGIQFMWNTCFESLDRSKKTKGSGCILAHCMGLGKTLQVIALVHTLLNNEEKTGVKKVMVVCPLSTVLNWVAEFKKWLPDDDVEVFELVSFKQNTERMFQVSEWDRIGGALILGYDMFRNLTNPSNKRLSKRMRTTFHTCLVEPGPQLVICDEGHLLKNEKTSISIAMNRLQTLRRIVLTGTPLQNNLKEYFCMVQFIKPNLLGTYREYLNRFVNPITNGQYTDSTPHDIHIMRKRSHVLHKLLDGVVQRKDYSVLAPFLPPKHEYVLFISLTELQIKLYEHYMKEKCRARTSDNGRSFVFVDFNEFQRICTHPRVLLNKSIELKQAKDRKDILDDESEGSLKDFIDDDDTAKSSSSNSSSSDSDSGSAGSHKEKKNAPLSKQRLTRATAAIYNPSDKEDSDKGESETEPSEWWRQYCTDEDLDNICHSGKLNLLFEILRHSEMIGDKVLIFSQSLYSLNVIEYFLNKIDEATQNSEDNSFCGFSGSWSLGLDYFRLDGSSSCDNRAAWCKTFNDPNNIRGRLFLISTRAGGLGINLVAANRVIIFDVSWNPSHDTQSIYRVYRFGQTKPSYIYRFVTLGAMEMKVYERQVTKQAISKRVIDEQQIDRHYNQSDLAELYKFEPVPGEERPIPLVPKDVLLGELLQMDKKIYKYHEHQSLLENKEDEVLNEEERKAAWEEFENEKIARSQTGTINNYPVQSLLIALQSIVRKENPAWNNDLVVQKTNEMFKQLQQEVETGSSPLFERAVVEVQRVQQNYIRMMQQQHALVNQYRQQQFLNNQANNHNYMNRMPTPQYPRNAMPSAAFAGQPSYTQNTVDYIDLND